MMSFFQIQATGLRPTSGISMSGKAPFVQDLSHHSCVIAILWRALPSYLHGGPQPADDIQHLSREASMGNLIEIQRYAERLQFEATCLQLWSNGIQDQIMEETQQVQTWMARMTGELNRLRRIQPGWLQQWQAKASLQPPQPHLQAPAQAASSSTAPGIPVKAAPVSKNPSMSSAPRNAPFPSTQEADPWACHQPRSQ